MMSRSMTYAPALAVAMLLLAGVTTLSGCGQSAEAKAAGTYDLDRSSMKTAIEHQIDVTDDPEEKMGMSMMLGFVDMMSMSLTINADGTASGRMTLMGDMETASGTWSLSGNAISITLAGEGEEPETMTGTLSGDHIELTLPDEDMPFKLVFRKRET